MTGPGSAGPLLEVVDLVKQLIKKVSANRTVLMVEHNMGVVADISDTITVLVNGQVLESGDPDTIRRSPAVQQAYLGHEGAEHV